MKKVNSIMLIDDDAATNFYHKIIIQRLNCSNRIEVFDDATEALQYLENAEELPDIIFLDINMPKMNGWEFIEEIVKNGMNEILNDSTIVVLTTSLNSNDKEKALKYGIISDFRLKPLTKETLLEVMDSL